MPPKSALIFFRDFSSEVLTAFTAFANTYGGTVVIGSNQFPIADIRNIQAEFSDSFKDIYPKTDFLYKSEIVALKNGFQLIIRVLPGNQTPYLFKNRAYIFRDGICLPADENDLQRLIQKNIDRIPFESQCSQQQNLTFAAFSKVLMGFSEDYFDKFHFKTEFGFFNNLALLCSDQNPYGIVFSDESKANRIEQPLEGSVFHQISTLKELLQPYSYTQKMLLSGKHDVFGFPETVVRTFLIQSVVQRDCRDNIPSVVRVKKDRIEFSVYNRDQGRIDPRIIFSDLEFRRNKYLADLFVHCGEMQRFGDDMKSCIKSYEGRENKPQIIEAPSALKLTLPKIIHLRPGCPLDKVLTAIKNHPDIDKPDIDSLVKEHSSAYNNLLLRTLVNEGVIFKINGTFSLNPFCF